MNRIEYLTFLGLLVMAITSSAMAEVKKNNTHVQANQIVPEIATTDLVTQGQRVFTCGHSFHVFVPIWLKQIAESAGITNHETVGISTISGSRIIQHWDVPEDRNVVKAALRAGKVDVLTLSPHFQPDEGIDNFTRLALANNPNIRIMIQESWLWYDNSEGYRNPVDFNAASIGHLLVIHHSSFMANDDYVINLNKKFGRQVLFVVPVGQAVIALRAKIITGQAFGLHQQADIFSDDLGHPKPPLAALVSYCHFAVIYRRSPVGLPIPSALVAGGCTDEGLNRLLQQLAWNAVIHHPLTGVRGSDAPIREITEDTTH